MSLLIVADGVGVDSTAVLIELAKRGIRPDAILHADLNSEKRETVAYYEVRRAWLKEVGFPDLTIVRYQPKDFKHWPPYRGLIENCLTNGTLPSLAFGFKSCSIKNKVAPQNQWAKDWAPAIEEWANGRKVRKIIGYDAGARDTYRYAHAKGVEDPLYDYWYPLIEWGMDREACKQTIRAAGQPVPPKSACIVCPATKPAELHEFQKSYLRLIVLMEARAKPRLMGYWTQEQIDAWYAPKLAKWEADRVVAAARVEQGLLSQQEFERKYAAPPRKPKVGDGCKGLWRSATRGRPARDGRPAVEARPAMMTDYIAAHRLLEPEEIKRIQEDAPKELLTRLSAYEQGLDDTFSWHDFLEHVTEEDAVHEEHDV